MAEQVNWRELYEENDCDGDKIIDVWLADVSPHAYRYIRDNVSGEICTSISIRRLVLKPKPKSYRPFKRGGVLCGEVFVNKIAGVEYVVLAVSNTGVWFVNGIETYATLLDNYTRLDGSPAGILE